MGRVGTITQGPASTPEPQQENDSAGTRKISLYEQSREDRIRENKERLQKLGIVELSEKFRSSAPKRTPQRRAYAEGRPTPVLQPVPTRRSSRLQNVTPVSYTEVPLKKKDGGGLEDQGIVLEEGSKPEVYMEEHDKLLGNTERSWELFVDGYGKDGKRIYDPIKGKTCHQCRQKTLGHRTKCTKCGMVQGQFCGDCLYMRYGEHVLEALENPNWICPVCRGICNCSLCRQAKGWPPTGPLYKKISRLGYKSVAHFLIQTRRSQTSEETPDLVCHSSVKRVLPFAEGEEIVTDGSSDSDKDGARTSDWKIEEEEKQGIHVPVKRPLSFSNKESEEIVCGEENANSGLLEPKVEEKPETHKSKDEREGGVVDEANNAKTKKRSISMVQDQDSIGGRPRERRTLQNGNNDLAVKGKSSQLENLENGNVKWLDMNSGTDDELAANNELLEPKVEEKLEQQKTENGEVGAKDKENHTKLKRKCAINQATDQDSIGGRLRQRRRMQNGNDDLPVTEKSSESKDLVNGLGKKLDMSSGLVDN